MKNRFAFLIVAFISSTSVYSQFSSMKAPIAKQEQTILEKHNHQRLDPYFWMNQRDSKPVLDYIAEENAYSSAYFSEIKPLTNTLLNEFEQRIDPNEESAPFRVNGQQYVWRNSEGKDYRQLFVFKNGEANLFFDENVRAAGLTYYGLGDWANSTDNKLLAFSEDQVGRRKYTIRIRQNKTNKLLKDEITNTDGSIVWANDNTTFFYVKKDETTLREFQVYRHVLGTSQTKDVLVYEENDERFSVFVQKTLDDQFICITSQSSTTSEVHLINAFHPEEKTQVFLARENGHLYQLDHHETGFFILSNAKSPNKKLVFSERVPATIESCKTIIAHSTKTYIDGFRAFKTKLVVESRTYGNGEFSYGNLDGSGMEIIPIEEQVYEVGMSLNDEYETKQFDYVYNSMTTPFSIIQFDFTTSKSKIIYQKQVLDKNFSSSNYVSERIWATANDGTLVPISIVYKKGIDLKKAPLLLYGYGSYGVTIPTNFSTFRLSLLDRGFVYAIAHIRGGKFLGEDWYQNGKLQHKRNTFTDFINSAEWLSMKGYCDPNSIYAQGGSAGGLLMGAVANLAPYLFKGIIAQVPFVDVVTTMLDETIPLTVGEYEEWGNPNEEQSYWYMLSYSPYDQVKKMNYPSMLITTGYHDSQVQYWEPLKWIAKLRTMNQAKTKLLFDCAMSAGHGGGSGRTTERLEVAKEFAFILHTQGIEK